MKPWSMLGTLLFGVDLITITNALPSLAGDSQGCLLHPANTHERFVKELRRDVNDALVRLTRRQAPASSASAPTSSSITPQSTTAVQSDRESWDAQTKLTCTQALNMLNGNASSNSGIAVCYNLPALENSTGIFQADLRLYRVSPPIKDWVGVVDQDIDIGLNYVGASVKSSSPPKTRRDNSHPSLDERATTAPLKMLQTFNFVGQISADTLKKPLNSTQLQNILSPMIVLTATNGQKKQVTTILSPKEASFVNGVMSSDTLMAAGTMNFKNAPFVMPGVTLGIFPIGLIVTGAWAVLGIAVVGWGTFGRYQFREHYRMRMKRANVIAVKTI
ncbi:MAG: hypothetical protein M4579_000671 [Chaenotheca gracillima]|nr:MAG: hypothetical protein M4579_000671 [Chaenotheca gracillima]